MGEAAVSVRIDQVGRRAREAAAVLAESLAEVPSSDRERRYLRHLMHAAVRDLAAHGRAFVALGSAGDGAAERVQGVLLAMPPDSVPITYRRRVRMAPSLLLAAGAAPYRLARSLRSAAAARVALPPGGWWYVHTIGVHPQAQGRGIGSRLLRHALGLVDTAGLACYLHTAPPTVAFYRRFGFALDQPESPATPEAGARSVRMVRPPATTTG